MMRTSTRHVGRSAHRAKPLAVQHAQQLGLAFGRQLADFVEEQRPLVGLLEQAGVGAVGTAEGPLDMAEQLRLEQSRRDGGAVDGDQRAVAARAFAVQAQGHQLLADAAFAHDQHVAGAGSHAGYALAELGHGGAIADDGVIAAAAVDAQAGVFGFEVAAGAEELQAVAQEAGQGLTVADLALGERLAILINVQRPQRSAVTPGQRQANGVAHGEQAVGRIAPLAAQPDQSALLQHALRQLPAQVGIDLGLPRQHQPREIVRIEAQVAGDGGPGLVQDAGQRPGDQRLGGNFLEGPFQEGAQGAQLVGMKDGMAARLVGL